MSSQKHIEVSNFWKIFTQDQRKIDVEDPEDINKAEKEDTSVIAVRDVSFDVNRTEVFVIMGLSGSGKSTLVRCLLRLVEPTHGTAIMDGIDVTALDTNELINFRREKIAMVFQHYGLLPHRTVIENVAFGLKIRGESKEDRRKKATEVLETVGLDGWQDYYPAELSGGMRQRVGIARALSNDPPILLMDEPTSGLDPLIRRELQEELLHLQEKMEKTTAYITHDLDEALRLGDRLAVMKAGRFVQAGTPKEVLQNPADDYVARFVQDKQEQLKEAEVI